MKPEPLMTGLPKRRPTEPAFMGWETVYCQGCGARGKANKRFLKRGQKTIQACRGCK